MGVTDELLLRGRAAWPGVDVSADAFAAWMKDRVAAEDDGPLHEDLYLACACARQDSSALRAFDAAFAPDFAALHRRFSYLADDADDIRQRIHEKLFVGERPRILDYAGRGGLRTWLRVAVTRMLVNAQTRETRELPVGEEIFLALRESSDPETAHVRATQGEAFRAAFAEAVARLGYRERNMLRYALVDGLGIDGIAKIHSIHRATAARWLADARDGLASHLRDALKERLRIGDSEVASLVRGVQSHLELTLARYLGPKR
jgi:RNA polymerase sigma-70 factor (ECF subfamily)